MDWQPIETAPKDGEPILVAGGVTMFDAETFETWRTLYGVQMAYGFYGDAWLGGCGSEAGSQHWLRPTHWMPLPPPPVTA